MVLSILLSLFLFISPHAEAASLAEMERLVGESSLLRSEYQLAKTSELYVLFDLVERKILIKVKGVVLRELPIESARVWGAPVEPRPLRLLKRSALIEPRRKEIKPKKNDDEEEASEIEVLEVKDMPTRYSFGLDGAIWLYVRPMPQGVASRLLDLLSSFKSYVFVKPVGALWSALHGERFTEVVLYLGENEARALYWTFQEGYRCILRNK